MIFDVAELVISVLTLIVIGYLTYLMLRFAAKPRVEIRFENGKRRIKVGGRSSGDPALIC